MDKGWKSNFKNINTPFNACFHCYCHWSIMHPKREAHTCEKKEREKRKKDQKMWEWTCRQLSVFDCTYFFVYICVSVRVCLLKEQLGCVDHLNPCYGSVDWHISYLLIWKCVHTVSYVIHTVRSSTCCFWQLGCWCEYVCFIHFFLSFFFFLLPQRSVIYCTCQRGAIKKPVIIVHPVNHIIFFYLVSSVFYESVSELPSWVLRL